MEKGVLRVTDWLIDHLENKLGFKVLPIVDMVTDNVATLIALHPATGGCRFNVIYSNENTWGLTTCLDSKAQDCFIEAVKKGDNGTPDGVKEEIVKLKGTDYMMIILYTETK